MRSGGQLGRSGGRARAGRRAAAARLLARGPEDSVGFGGGCSVALSMLEIPKKKVDQV